MWAALYTICIYSLPSLKSCCWRQCILQDGSISMWQRGNEALTYSLQIIYPLLPAPSRINNNHALTYSCFCAAMSRHSAFRTESSQSNGPKDSAWNKENLGADLSRYSARASPFLEAHWITPFIKSWIRFNWRGLLLHYWHAGYIRCIVKQWKISSDDSAWYGDWQGKHLLSDSRESWLKLWDADLMRERLEGMYHPSLSYVSVTMVR